MSRSNLVAVVLELLSASGNRIETRIRFQKTAYLLQAIGVDEFQSIYFTYHHYGPYSRELSSALRDAVLDGLIDEQREDYGSGELYKYSMQPKGDRWLVEAGIRATDEVERAARYLKAMPWRALELAATIIYLEKEQLVDARGDAVTQALHLKPECERFLSEAQGIIDELEL